MRGVRLLSFDGGGIRGLSSLIILDKIMDRIKHDESLSEDPRPCDYFDLIGGTSTGGIIALMLGRLRMSVPQAIAEYVRLAEYIFSEKKLKWKEGTFKARKLESAIKDVVDKYPVSSSDDGRMLDPCHRDDVCKSFVCAMLASDMDTPYLFRTYHVKHAATANCFMWEAARATSADPTFFKRITIVINGLKEEFIDGRVRCNNPVLELIEEAGYVFAGRPIACILSIGTGQAKAITLQDPAFFQRLLPTDLIRVLRDIATDCESVGMRVERQYDSTPGTYFRFNVDQGLQEVSLSEWDKHPEVTRHTRQYLAKAMISQKLDVLVQLIRAQIRDTMKLH